MDPENNPFAMICAACEGAGGWIEYVIYEDTDGDIHEHPEDRACSECGGCGWWELELEEVDL